MQTPCLPVLFCFLFLLWIHHLSNCSINRLFFKNKPGIHVTVNVGSNIKCMKNLGCFGNGPPFFHPINRPISFLPKNRELIPTIFSLYTPLNRDHREILKADHQETIEKSNYNPRWPTKMIVHGFMDNSFFTSWMQRMKDEFLSNGDFNVILVDWPLGSFLFFRQAVANCQVVGAEIAFLIRRLQEINGVRPESFHILGHSLGAHIAGYAGKRIKSLGRITGLDVGAPYFRDVSSEVRLDAKDAILVDNIHTNAGQYFIQGLGTSEAVGHLDFYPNGGNYNPGCKIFPKIKAINLYDLFLSVIFCNHFRSFEYFIASIKYPDCFVGVPCGNYNDFVSGKCVCSEDNPCFPMGLNVDMHIRKNFSQILYLKTGSESPYCLFQYQIVMELEGLSKKLAYNQQLLMTIQALNQRKESMLFLTKDGHFPKFTYTFLMTLQTRLERVHHVWLSWPKEHTNILNIGKNTNYLRVKYFILTPITIGNKSSKEKWCGSATHLFPDQTARIPKINCEDIYD
ncbi:pancreatic lipase-related protein 2-like [Centruroides sculpturatus]|uniref:pancreatic lipase-related protein 2-like n=1 Tax=Centruroides sculpturatus TaxID=218467 RepID=UPI000C6EB385|nr:pancreatic lipase-related protein 2-like [Centruroides sculpturatus]